MFTSKLTRRALCGARRMAFAGPAASRVAHRGARVSPSGVHVDVEPLRANAGDPTATWVAEKSYLRN